jgi:predicted DNA-binding WGR domain protein
MPHELRSLIKHYLVLHRIDSEQGVRKFYSFMIVCDLFGAIRLVCQWGRVGTPGREMVTEFPTEMEAGKVLEALAEAQRLWGYRDL